MDVTVITASRPDRPQLLAEAMHSVAEQTRRPVAHLIGIDHDQRGPARIRDDLVRAASTPWVAFLDDDDLLDPEHLEVLASHARAADVVYPDCRFDGPPLPEQYRPRGFHRPTLAQHGIFPITVIARREAIIDAGGFDPTDRYEDWALWNRMADRGCTFRFVNQPTWTYRTVHPDRRTNL